MPIDSRLLDILCCPTTRVALRTLDSTALEKINRAIGTGQVKRIDGQSQTAPLQEALITVDGQRIYRIDDGIPVMLADEAIAAQQIEALA
jgi:uncharacterized protein YbaR (Trm112 family)